MVSTNNIKLRTNNICKTFTRRTGATLEVLKDISLDIKDGEFITIVGASGCGKTTVLKIIAGFEKPDSGSISLNGQPIGHVPPNKRPFGMVFQNYALFPHLTAFENLAFGLRIPKS